MNVDKALLDIATLFKFIPWVLGGDQRDHSILIANAMRESNATVSSSEHEDISCRKGLMRMLLFNLLNNLNVKPDHNFINATVDEIINQHNILDEKEAKKKEVIKTLK